MNLTKKIVTSYAKSLFQNVNSMHLEQTKVENSQLNELLENNEALTPNIFLIGEELSIIGNTLVVSKAVQGFFKNPTYREQQKLEFLLAFFPGMTLTMKSFLKILTERNHLSLLSAISEEYSNLLLRFKKSTKVNLITASILQPTYGEFLLKTLKELTKSKEILLRIAYNPNLLGGLIIEYNSTSTDASILKEFSLFFNESV